MWRGGGFRAARRWLEATGGPEAQPPAAWYQCPQLFVGSHLSAWANQNVKGFELLRDPVPAQGGQQYLMQSVEVLLVQLCTVQRALRRHYGPSVEGLASRLVTWRRGLHGQAKAKRQEQQVLKWLRSRSWSPSSSQVCDSVLQRTHPSSVMLGLSSIAFWSSDADPGYCTPPLTLMEQWERHLARSALLFLGMENASASA
eukprot:CAMPEP_0179028898 /NCGR_PEP_ID=MMETSP0796-20121207/9777_1 /TAXON_ID=73915 /ORGANISM="Pyrodinium bahamense, Strain pbaha01" /LENGTH=199 /DNA_ID=CAMNT_0020725043 /DNA_START=18 /DNA_END=617 /DNA_ORIENTATION=+